MQTQTSIQTPNATKLIKRLSKHWAHKLTIREEADITIIEFERATCQLSGDEQQLHAVVSAENTDDLNHFADVVARHLHRMNAAIGDELNIEWQV